MQKKKKKRYANGSAVSIAMKFSFITEQKQTGYRKNGLISQFFFLISNNKTIFFFYFRFRDNARKHFHIKIAALPDVTALRQPFTIDWTYKIVQSMKKPDLLRQSQNDKDLISCASTGDPRTWGREDVSRLKVSASLYCLRAENQQKLFLSCW